MIKRRKVMQEAKAAIKLQAEKYEAAKKQKLVTLIEKKATKVEENKVEEDEEPLVKQPTISKEKRLSMVLKSVTLATNFKSKRQNNNKEMEKSLRSNEQNKTVCYKYDERKKFKDNFYSTLKVKTEIKLK